MIAMWANTPNVTNVEIYIKRSLVVEKWILPWALVFNVYFVQIIYLCFTHRIGMQEDMLGFCYPWWVILPFCTYLFRVHAPSLFIHLPKIEVFNISNDVLIKRISIVQKN